jgi:hypothetical protein
MNKSVVWPLSIAFDNAGLVRQLAGMIHGPASLVGENSCNEHQRSTGSAVTGREKKASSERRVISA